MIKINKAPMNLLDDLYSLAYWMTGSEQASTELVTSTYRDVKADTHQTDMLKRFRKSYIDRYGQDAELDMKNKGNGSCRSILPKLRERAADIKLSVLLSEIPGLKHKDISVIMDKPVETIRLWLFCGRKFMINESILKASA